MQISVQTGGIEEKVGSVDACYRMISEAGFDAVDVNLDHLLTSKEEKAGVIPAVFDPKTSEQDMLQFFRPWKEAAGAWHLQNAQAHAPYPSRFFDVPSAGYNDFLMEALRRTIIGTAYIGCHKLVIHPFFYDYDHQMSEKDEWNLNMYCYGQLAETAKKMGVTILLENMFVRHKGRVYAAVCNDGREAASYVDALNENAGSEVFGFCLDTGHALIAGKDIRRFMNELGPRIKAFHVHDNNGHDDQHLAPYMGVLDWKRFVQGLQDIGYKDTLSFETFNVCNRYPVELYPSILKTIELTGRRFSRLAEEGTL